MVSTQIELSLCSHSMDCPVLGKYAALAFISSMSNSSMTLSFGILQESPASSRRCSIMALPLDTWQMQRRKTYNKMFHYVPKIVRDVVEKTTQQVMGVSILFLSNYRKSLKLQKKNKHACYRLLYRFELTLGHGVFSNPLQSTWNPGWTMCGLIGSSFGRFETYAISPRCRSTTMRLNPLYLCPDFETSSKYSNGAFVL